MKLTVDNMPSKPQQCLFANRLYSDGWRCMFTHKVCENTDKCRYLKTHNGSSFLEKEFNMNTKTSKEWISVCPKCGGHKTAIIKDYVRFEFLYYGECIDCGFRTDHYIDKKDAIGAWNELHKAKEEGLIKPRFATEVEIRDFRNCKPLPCLCDSEDHLICVTGNPKAPLYFVRCKACECESEQFSSIRDAVDAWNKDVATKGTGLYTPYIYQVDATRTADTKLSAEKKILEGLVGINSEAGEALDIWKKYEFHKHDLDAKAIALELGDVLWYLTEAAVALGYSLEDIMKMNIEKLNKRYPDGFDPERSKNRED